MQYQSPTAQRFTARLNHLAFLTSHRCDIPQEELNDELIKLNTEIMLYLTMDVELPADFYTEHIKRVQDSLTTSVNTPEFQDGTNAIRKATQAFRNQISAESLAPVLALRNTK